MPSGGRFLPAGLQKAYDLKTSGISSVAITRLAANPYMQLDLGAQRTDMLAVKLVARADSRLDQSQYLDVWVSNSTNFRAGGVLVEANVTFDTLGDESMVIFPSAMVFRYVTVLKNTTVPINFALQEIMPLYDGEWQITAASAPEL